MTFWCCIKKTSFSSVYTFEELVWVTFFSEINQIFVISVNSYIGVWSPCSLYLLSGNLVLCFQLNLLLSLKETSPCPLNLNSSNMIHSKSVVFEKTSGQWHFVCCLDQGGTKVSQTCIFIFLHYVEWRGQKLLSELLSCCQMCTKIAWCIHIHILCNSCLLHPLLLLNLVYSKLLLLHLINLCQLL